MCPFLRCANGLFSTGVGENVAPFFEIKKIVTKRNHAGTFTDESLSENSYIEAEVRQLGSEEMSEVIGRENAELLMESK